MSDCPEGASCPTIYRNLLGMEWLERDQPLPIVAAFAALAVVMGVAFAYQRRRSSSRPTAAATLISTMAVTRLSVSWLVFALLWPWSTSDLLYGPMEPSYRNLLGMEWPRRMQPLPIVAAFVGFAVVMGVAFGVQRHRSERARSQGRQLDQGT